MFFIVVILTVVLIPIMWIMWGNQKQELGTIQCKRCHHVGPARGLFVPFRGIKPVCQKCQSEDWVKIDNRPTQT